tara:strand:- start:78 stop:296 length:219 start_codon:yes stop_codon:yes gene_type:complete
MRKAVVDRNGVVANAIEIEDGASWTPPKGAKLLNKSQSDQADIGDKVVGSTLIKPAFTDREGRRVVPEPIAL